MKTIGVLFDVSGSMKNKFTNIKNSDNMNKKSDELIRILKNLGKNINANIFSILFGLQNSPYIIDFIQLLKLSNEKFKNITSTEENSNTYRNKLIYLLSKDQEGNERYCNIHEYVFSQNGPSEKLSEFFCNLMEDDREIIDYIYYLLPKEVTNENENKKANLKMKRGVVGGSSTGMIAGTFVGLGLSFIPVVGPFLIGLPILLMGFGGNAVANNQIKNTIKEETIKAIKNSFKSCIEIKAKKIINEYKLKNPQNYELIKGKNILNLIDDMNKKIIQPENDQNISIMDLFDNIIYGNTPLYSCCKKALEIFKNNQSKTKVLFIISDGLLNDNYNIISAQNEIKQKMDNLDIITICIYLNCSNKSNNKTFYNEIQYNFDDGAKFLFNISSELDYHNGIIKFFHKKKLEYSFKWSM